VGRARAHPIRHVADVRGETEPGLPGGDWTRGFAVVNQTARPSMTTMHTPSTGSRRRVTLRCIALALTRESAIQPPDNTVYEAPRETDLARLPRTQGARSNDKKLLRRKDEPDDHAIGRSRGALTTKTHALVDGNGLPLVIAVAPGQANDSPALPKLLAELRVPRLGLGRPRTRPEALRRDKAYPARAHRAHLRARGIAAVIPEQADQVGHRQNTGSRGGRQVDFDATDYKKRNVVERAFNHMKNWRGPATRYDKHALAYRGGVVLAAILLWLA
jgi:transposase